MPIRVAAVLTVALASLCVAARAQDAALVRLYTEAQSAQRAGDLPKAAARYEEIVRLQPGLAEAHANLGSIYYQLRDDRKAAASLQRAVALKPQLAAPHFFLGAVAIRQQDHDGAVQHLERAVGLDPSNPVAALYLGEAHFGAGRYRPAAAAFWKATRHEDYRADAYYSLNRACVEIAERSLDRLAAEHPRSFQVHVARGHLHEGRKSWAKAKAEYRAALKENPAAPGLEARLAWVSRNAAEGPSAGPPPPLEATRPTLLGLLYDPPAAQDIARLLGKYGDRLATLEPRGAAPEALYRQAEDFQVIAYLAARWIGAHDPGSYRAHQLRAQLHEARGETDEAVRQYRSALRLRPDLKDVHFAIGTLLWALSRFDEALPELRAELRINPNHAEAHYEIADILQLRGQSGDAKRHLLESIRVDPRMIEAHLAIERIYFAEGLYDKGIDHLDRVKALAPSDPTPHYRLSVIYRRLGKTAESQAALAEFQRRQD